MTAVLTYGSGSAVTRRDPSSVSAKRGYRIGAAIAIAAAVLHGFAMDPRLTDDAYISFRYAANLASGTGLVFNPGHHVEGFSNPLWTFLLAGADRLHFALPITSWILGMVFLAGALWLTVRLAARAGLGPIPAAIAALALALTVDMVRASLLGLEVAMYAAALIAGVLTTLDTTRRASICWVAAILALGLTRPEGMLVGALLVGLRLALGHRDRAAKTAAAGAAMLLSIEVGRYLYYGQIVPNSVTAKRDVGFSPWSALLFHRHAGLVYIAHGLGLRLLPLAGVFLIGLVLVVRYRLQLPLRLLIVIATTVAVGAFVIVANGGDWMSFFRLGVPYLPLLFVLAIVIVDAVGRGLSRRRWAPIAAVATLGVSFVALQPARATYLHTNVFTPQAFGSPYDAMGIAWRDSAARAHRVFATPVIGRLGYFSRPAVISDMYGLTDATVAWTHERGSAYGKFNLAYTAGLRPDALEDTTWPLLQKFAGQARDPYLGLVSPSLSNDHLFVLVRADEGTTLGMELARRSGARLVPANAAISAWRAASSTPT